MGDIGLDSTELSMQLILQQKNGNRLVETGDRSTSASPQHPFYVNVEGFMLASPTPVLQEKARLPPNTGFTRKGQDDGNGGRFHVKFPKHRLYRWDQLEGWGG